MSQANGFRGRVAWTLLLLNGVAILGFGILAAAAPASPEDYSRATGMATIGMGLFGSLISVTAFRRHEIWAWACLWYHIHQIVGIASSLVGLFLPVRDFFPAAVRIT